VSVSRRSKILFVAAASALVLSACAGRDRNTELAYEERPVELLYLTGADRLDRRQWESAIGYFREVERQHPYSEWSRRAILMTAFANYQSNQYGEAIGDADRFLSLYPGNPSAPYAYYLKAICYFEQIVDVNRDQAFTELAQNALLELVQRYPNSEYAQDARLKIDMVNDQLAGKEMTIGRYYLNQGDTLASVGRFRRVVDQYQTTTHTPEALYRLVEAYLTLGLADEARRNGAVLGANYPGDAWYADAYRLLTDSGLRPQVEPRTPGSKQSLLSRLISNKQATPPPPGEARTPQGFTGRVLGL
jgi:outer membrane protein assembly factor BamD